MLQALYLSKITAYKLINPSFRLMSTFQNALRFNQDMHQILSDTDSLLKEWGLVLEKVVSSPVSFENTILPFQRMDSTMGTQINNLNFFSSVSDSKEIRDASIKSSELIDQFFIDLDMREDVYAVLEAYLKTNPKHSSPEEGRYVQHLLRDYQRNGMDKDADTRAQIKQL